MRTTLRSSASYAWASQARFHPLHRSNLLARPVDALSAEKHPGAAGRYLLLRLRPRRSPPEPMSVWFFVTLSDAAVWGVKVGNGRLELVSIELPQVPRGMPQGAVAL
jgi:hypothetical protein